MKIRRPTGTRVGQCSETSKFIRKPFAQIVPEDFKDYIDKRCQEVADATVDREIDIFSAVCRMAIDTWRIHVVKSPMDGVRRPRYYNERDRRLKGDEEERLLSAAYEEDREDLRSSTYRTLAATGIHACCCVTPTFAPRVSPSGLTQPLPRPKNPTCTTAAAV
jgi:hypothetical protein